MSNIYRNLVISSGIAVMLAMVSIGLVCRHYAVQDLIAVAENRNIAVAQALSHNLHVDFDSYLPAVRNATREELLARPETERLDRWLTTLTPGLTVLRIKIYAKDGRTVYSSNHDQIGEEREEEQEFATVAYEGRALSELSSRDTFTAFSEEVFNRDIIETYTPIRAANGAIIGVFEIYADVTDVAQRVQHAVTGIIGGLILVFLVFYGSLVLVIMRRAMAPLKQASTRAAAIGPRSSGVRLPTERMPGEVLPLVEAVNGALDRLDSALDSQRRFTADAAHELLTPLAVLRANLDTMNDQQTAARLRADLEDMSNVVNQLLELAGMDALNPEEAEPVDVREVSGEVLANLAPVAVRQGKALALTGEEKPPAVRCDRKALGRALRNLVINAISHAPANTTIEIEIGRDAAISVKDSGPGVAPADRERIFDRFWRAERGDRPGAGIGLSIVKTVADTYGGSISVGDAPSGGAIFTLRLPHAAPKGR